MNTPTFTPPRVRFYVRLLSPTPGMAGNSPEVTRKARAFGFDTWSQANAKCEGFARDGFAASVLALTE